MRDKQIAEGNGGKNLFDEEFLSEVLSDKEACQYVLRKLLNVDDLTVTKVTDRVKSTDSYVEGEIVDVSGIDGRGFTWEIALCRTDKVEPQHSRFQFARLAGYLTGTESLDNDTWEMAVVYVGTVDHYGTGKSKYEIRTFIEETNEMVDDGSRIIFANSEVDDGNEIVPMMQYFKTADPDDDSQGALSKRVRQLKCEGFALI